jgi:hypothetical protein
MIEGINYYPQKKKSKGILKWWILFMLFAVSIAYWYLNDNKVVEKQDSTLIIISEPENDLKEQQSTVFLPVKVDSKEYIIPITDNFEKLDEVIQNYNRENK